MNTISVSSVAEIVAIHWNHNAGECDPTFPWKLEWEGVVIVGNSFVLDLEHHELSLMQVDTCIFEHGRVSKLQVELPKAKELRLKRPKFERTWYPGGGYDANDSGPEWRTNRNGFVEETLSVSQHKTWEEEVSARTEGRVPPLVIKAWKLNSLASFNEAEVLIAQFPALAKKPGKREMVEEMLRNEVSNEVICIALK